MVKIFQKDGDYKSDVKYPGMPFSLKGKTQKDKLDQNPIKNLLKIF